MCRSNISLLCALECNTLRRHIRDRVFILITDIHSSLTLRPTTAEATTPFADILQGVQCPEGLTASTDVAHVVSQSEILLMVIPTPFVARTMEPLAHLLRPDHILVSCTKGILNDTLETPNEVSLSI